MRSVFCQPSSGRECYSNLPEFLKNKWETRWNYEWGRRGDPNSHKMKNTYISQIIFFSLLTVMASGIFTLVEWFGEGKKKKKDPKDDFSYFEYIFSSCYLFISECNDWAKAAPLTMGSHLWAISQVSEKSKHIILRMCIFQCCIFPKAVLFTCINL